MEVGQQLVFSGHFAGGFTLHPLSLVAHPDEELLILFIGLKGVENSSLLAEEAVDLVLVVGGLLL